MIGRCRLWGSDGIFGHRVAFSVAFLMGGNVGWKRARGTKHPKRGFCLIVSLAMIDRKRNVQRSQKSLPDAPT